MPLDINQQINQQIDQLEIRLNNNDKNIRTRWKIRRNAAMLIISKNIEKLRKKALDILLELLVNDEFEYVYFRSDVATFLGKECANDDYTLRTLIPQMETHAFEVEGVIWLMVENNSYASKSPWFLLHLLNDKDPKIRKGTLKFFLESEWEGKAVVRDYIDLEMISVFEELVEYYEGQQLLDYWLEFHSTDSD